MGWTVYNSDGQILQGSSTLADDAVTTAKILNLAVTNAKLATSAITGAPDLGEAPATGDSLLISDTSASAALKEITVANLFTAPAITGNATAATQVANNSSTRISTTAYVQTELTAYAADTVTFTNKTYDADATGNTLTNIEVANLKSGVLDTDISSVSGSDDTLASAKSIKTYVDAQVTAQDLDATTDSGTIDIDLDSETLTIAGGEGIDTSASGTTITIAGEEASTSNKGVASFHSDNFAVSSGVVTIKAGGVAMAEIATTAGDAGSGTFLRGDGTWATVAGVTPAKVMAYQV